VELIRGLHNLRDRHRGCVLTIGNFDGVHLGHQAVVAQLAARAPAAGVPSVLMTFEPQPQEFFAAAGAPARLTRLREKLKVLAGLPLDRVLVVRFDRGFSRLAPDEFVERLLVGGLHVRQVVVGGDFHYGHGGQGDFEGLRAAGERFSFQVVRRDTVRRHGRRVSSSWVRDLLAAGRLSEAAALLGRRYSMTGRVTGGDRLGRTLGYPTANIPLGRRVSPVVGVFAVRAVGLAPHPLPAMASVGTRPTVRGTDWRLEVHIFDFDRDIYGRYVEVEFVHRLREEVCFDSLEALKAQLGRDEAQARELLARDEESVALDRR
jgi:riboflavin kinase/FMN adenylyltransferase